MSGHCEHCGPDCLGGERESHYCLGADVWYEAWWDSGKCPMCAATKAERRRIVVWLRERWSRCEAPPRGTLAQHELRLAEDIERGSRLERP